eukprot:160457-Hanusia_phi.AAC.2
MSWPAPILTPGLALRLNHLLLTWSWRLLLAAFQLSHRRHQSKFKTQKRNAGEERSLGAVMEAAKTTKTKNLAKAGMART